MPHNSNIVSHTSQQNKNMPDGMSVRDFSRLEKQHADHICESTSSKPDQAFGGKSFQEGVNCNYHKPAHSHIRKCGEERELTEPENLVYNSYEGKSPDDAEQSPTNIPSQAHQCNGCVGSGNQEIYCTVIYCSPEPFLTGGAAAMVERGAGVESDKSNRVNDSSKSVPGISQGEGQKSHPDKRSNRGYQANTVRERIPELFFWALKRAVHYS